MYCIRTVSTKYIHTSGLSQENNRARRDKKKGDISVVHRSRESLPGVEGDVSSHQPLAKEKDGKKTTGF